MRVSDAQGSMDFGGTGGGDFLLELVQQFGADVNLSAKDGMTPLMEATRYGNFYSVRQLLDIRADPKAANGAGHTALDIARMQLPEYLSERESCTSSASQWKSFSQEVQKGRDKVA